ncbi:MAG TPA: protein kinase [Solirubrobacteraceae bacterium]|jgi:serine/threonine-protein kinase|nr:protein kinase [Solirubrobacteraceae bacterium]
MLHTGDILVGRYEVDTLLGRGGMSSVFSGWDRTLGREVAIKVLATELVEDGVFVERFEREARAAASLSHRNVVAVFDSGVDEDARFIVMEHVSGRTLADLLRDGPMPVAEALEIAIGVAHALGAAHARGIVHRDVKPGNVMLAENAQVKVLDFGIARAPAATSLTLTSTVIGTAGYLSPEQAEGRAVDARSDLYALGCVLYEMLTGRPPFLADSAAALVHQHATRQPEPPSRFRREVSPRLDAIVLRCLAKNPRDRYPRAQSLAAALTAVRNARASGAGPPVGPLRATRSRRAQVWTAVSVLTALALVLALFALAQGGGGGAVSARDAASAAPPPAARVGKAAPASAPAHSATAPPRSLSAAASPPASPARPAASAGSSRGAGALGALTLSDLQRGLIDERAAEEISHRTAPLLAALASGKPAEAAAQLAQFAERVDALAAGGQIATPAAAEALKAAAAGLARTLLSGPAGTPPAAVHGAGDAGGADAAGPGKAHKRAHDGPGDTHD